MSQAARKRAAHRRIQPYAWLGVGAMTLGMGAALVGGTAVAFAGTGGAPSTNSSGSASSDTSSTNNDGPRQRVTRGPRASAVGDNDAPPAASPVRRDRGPAVAPNPEPTPDLTPEADVDPAAAVQAPPPVTLQAAPESAVADNQVPAAGATAPATTPKRIGRLNRDAAVEAGVPRLPDSVPAVDDSPFLDPAPAAAVAPAAVDPAPSVKSWLPGGSNAGTTIVPGEHVTLALKQIEASQTLITEVTWGSGNILAGLGSLGPQAALATAQLMLGIWVSSIANAQDLVASTVGNPLIHGFAQANLQIQLLYPKLSDASLATASALIPTLGWFGADVTLAEDTVADARQNGKIYAKVPIQMKLGTQPMVNVKIAGGRNASLLLDAGASGLVTTRDKIGTASLGAKTGQGNSCFSGGLCYHYETYNTTVDLGDGAVATAPVNIVTDIPGDPDYENSVANFKEFFSWGADGILGVGANTAGPGPVPIPTAAMPGELSDGVLIYQNAYPFGLGGYMILGPNLFPTKVSLPGAPDAYVKVSVNGGPPQDGAAIIDSGGVYGTLNRSLSPAVGTNVAAGTKIDVYALDGTTLLYTYTTQSGNSATPYIETGLFNTGNAPYAQNPIYINYGYDKPYGIGSMDFSIY